MSFSLWEEFTYYNGAAVGRAIRDSKVPRSEIFVITKIYPSQFDDPEAAIERTLKTLNIGYIDLLLLHHLGEGGCRGLQRHGTGGEGGHGTLHWPFQLVY